MIQTPDTYRKTCSTVSLSSSIWCAKNKLILE